MVNWTRFAQPVALDRCMNSEALPAPTISPRTNVGINLDVGCRFAVQVHTSP